MASAAEQLAANLNFGAFSKATDLHKRLLFTLGALIVYRLGTYIPLPGIDMAAFSRAFNGQSNGIFGMMNMFAGGAVEKIAGFLDLGEITGAGDFVYAGRGTILDDVLEAMAEIDLAGDVGAATADMKLAPEQTECLAERT